MACISHIDCFKNIIYITWLCSHVNINVIFPKFHFHCNKTNEYDKWKINLYTTDSINYIQQIQHHNDLNTCLFRTSMQLLYKYNKFIIAIFLSFEVILFQMSFEGFVA